MTKPGWYTAPGGDRLWWDGKAWRTSPDRTDGVPVVPQVAEVSAMNPVALQRAATLGGIDFVNGEVLNAIVIANEKPNEKRRRNYHDTNGIIAATDRRVIYLGRGLARNIERRDIRLDDIVTMYCDAGRLLGTLTIETRGATWLFMVGSDEGRRFAEVFNSSRWVNA